MEAKKRQLHYQNTRTSYVEGSTARKLNVVPDIYREERPKREPTPWKQVHRQPRGMSGMNFATLLVLTIAIIATLYTCVVFLQLQTEVSKLDKTILSLEKELVVLSSQNDAAFESIKPSYDLDHVYQVAVEELGMVYPNENMVITYQSSDESYVRQYSDIPD